MAQGKTETKGKAKTKGEALVEADARTLLARAEAGERLSTHERRRALAHMLLSRGDLWPTALLAEFFGVDEAAIREDLRAIKRILAEGATVAEDPTGEAAGELLLMLHTHLAVLDRYLTENADRLRTQEVVALLRERRELINSVVERLTRLQEW